MTESTGPHPYNCRCDLCVWKRTEDRVTIADFSGGIKTIMTEQCDAAVKSLTDKIAKDVYANEITKAAHYNGLGAQCSKCGHPIECIDVVEQLDFCLGNAMKYIWRAFKKEDPIKDLKKARYYLDRTIARLEKK